METARGRWFLEEYARRNHGADTAKVLAAIERIEGVIRGKDEAYRSFRAELLEMAEAIARTRAEVMAPVAESQNEAPAPPPAHPDVFAAAERIKDVAWAMRERGLDPRTCEQIEALAASILSASSLGDPDDHRAHKLGEVLQYLERRINAMLEGCAEVAQEPTEGRSEPAALPAAAAPDLPDPGEARPAIKEALAEPTHSMPTQDVSMHDDARQPIETPQPEPASAVAAETASITDPESPMDVAPSEAGAPQPEPSMPAGRPAPGASTGATGAEPPDFLQAPLPPPTASRSQPERAEQPTAPAVPSAKTMPAAGPAAPPKRSRDAAAPVAAPTPRPPARDPLAPLRAMSDAERIALFS